MGLKDKLVGTRYPAAGVAPVGADQLRAALMGLNAPDRVWVVRDGTPEQVDLVAEWRMDESVQGVYFMTRADRMLRTRMRFDDTLHEVRAIDESWQVSWYEGLPKALGSNSQTWGNLNISQKVKVRDANGVVHDFTFRSADMKDPLRETVTAAGWTWRGRWNKL